MKLKVNSKNLPILYEGDVIVVGGSFSGVSSALTFAETGYKVILIEPRTYLGREITATLRPWLKLDEYENNTKEGIPRIISCCIDTSDNFVRTEIPLKPDRVKICLEDLLLNSGVKILYASQPTGLYVEGDTLKGIIIGNKSGRQVILGRVIIDATETATIARLGGAHFISEPPGYAKFRRTLEFTKVSSLSDSILPISQSIGINNNQIYLHQGYLDRDHILVEYELEFPSSEQNLETFTQREILARYKGIELANYLVHNVKAFEDAVLASSSYELCGPYVTNMESPTPLWAHNLGSMKIQPLGEIPLEIFAGPIPNIFLLQEAARVELSLIKLFYNPVFTSFLGGTLAKSIIENWNHLVNKEQSYRVSISLTSKEDKTEDSVIENLEVRELESPQKGRDYTKVSTTSEKIPVLCKTDVLVVGGGTSGAISAIVAAKEGAKVALVDINPSLGGTGTFGGVNIYWFGRRIGFVKKIMESVENVHRKLKYQIDNWIIRDVLYNSLFQWNIEAKIFALLQEAERLGIQMYFNSIAIGSIVEGNKVKGIIVATRFGIYALLADIIIDATGDGDIAAFAGAKFDYGSPRDHSVMWYSLPQFVRPGQAQNNFTSMVDVSNIEDYTRAILVGRRFNKACYDHGIYLAPRESRHIIGDVTITLTDQLLQRHWPDVIYEAVSNHDIKGKSNSYWTYSGLIPPNLAIEIPYRALLPKGLENILVVGKALSATHDGLAAIRMQCDLENLGGIAGLIAAKAVREKKTLREIDIGEIQLRLIEEGVIDKDTVNRPVRRRYYSNSELEELVKDLLKIDKPLWSYADMDMGKIYRGLIPFVEVCTVGPRIIPFLEQALNSAEDRFHQVLIAQALALYGSQTGVPILISEIEKHLSAGKLPTINSHIRYAQTPPDQAAMPEVVYLLYSLGMTRDKRSINIWDRVADLLLDITEEDFRDKNKSIFYYVDSICFGIERLGDPAAIPILEKLHNCPLLKDQAVKTGLQIDYIQERRAMLELAIGRAMARCGSYKGIEILINYLDDNRALLAEQAHTELVSISGKDYGKSKKIWLEWLEENKNFLKPCPLREDFKMVYETYTLNTFQYYGVI